MPNQRASNRAGQSAAKPVSLVGRDIKEGTCLKYLRLNTDGAMWYFIEHVHATSAFNPGLLTGEDITILAPAVDKSPIPMLPAIIVAPLRSIMLTHDFGNVSDKGSSYVSSDYDAESSTSGGEFSDESPEVTLNQEVCIYFDGILRYHSTFLVGCISSQITHYSKKVET